MNRKLLLMTFLAIMLTGIGCVEFEVQKLKACGSSSMGAVIVDQFGNWFPNSDFNETGIVSSILENAGFSVYYNKSETITVPFYQEIAKHNYAIIILRVNSLLRAAEPVVDFLTSEEYNESKYVDKQQNGELTKACPSPPPEKCYFAITPKFIEESVEGDFPNSIVVAMGCNSLNNTSMAEAFMKKGAKAYIGWTGLVEIPHTDNETVELLRNLLIKSKTLSEAVDLVNPDPSFGSRMNYYPLDAGNLIILPVHNLDTGLNYTTIQEAINAPETLDGHTIFVEAGIYYENIVVSKAIRLVGENRNITILDGSKVDNVAKVTVDNVSIIGFAIQNSGSEWQHDFGVDLTSRRNCRVENCTIQNHAYAVYLAYAVNNTIGNNIIANASSYAIMINWFSRDNNVTNNTLIHNYCGVEIEEDCEGNIIAYNNISLTTYHAVYLLRSNANFVLNNLLSFNGYSNPPLIYAGIKLMYSNNNTLANNLIFNNTGGIQVYFDWGSKPARHNIIMNNTIENNDYGVIINYEGNQSHPSTGTYNQLCENTLQSNDYGIYLSGSDHNTFYHNNFLGSIYKEVVSVNSTNTWDANFEGNYWSNYTGVDPDHDGIGDTLYVIDANNTDHFPLMGMFSDFGVTSEHNVQAICNSTISDFQFNGTAISLNVTGENGTTGFCRICIPTALMNDTFRVFVNDTEILPSPEPLPCSNSTYSYLYFTYHHSTQEVVIVPEFPSFLILPLFMIVTLLAVIAYKRKYSK